MRKKIGLFFGSFNPIHMGHLMIAQYMAQFEGMDQVWFVVSPQNPLKEKSSLANMFDRLEMVEGSIQKSNKLRASIIEFNLPQPSYTIDTLVFLKEKHPLFDFVLIMGSDNLFTLNKWKNYELLLRDYKIAVYPRPGYIGHELEKHPSVHMTNTPLFEISSTFIRKAIKDQKSIRYFVPDFALDFIESKGLYR